MAKSYADLLREARSDIPEISPGETELLRERDGATILDVREASEWEQGHIPGAVHLSRSWLEQRVEGAIPDHDKPVVIYCASGVRSLFSGQLLRSLGYRDVKSMSSGFQGWKSAGLPWTMPAVLSHDQKQRYSRHLLIPEVGTEGQAKLLDSKVLLIGAGGLGSPSSMYLAAAGVGTIGVVDDDAVDASNLQRQILHSTERIGTPSRSAASLTR